MLLFSSFHREVSKSREHLTQDWEKQGHKQGLEWSGTSARYVNRSLPSETKNDMVVIAQKSISSPGCLRWWWRPWGLQDRGAVHRASVWSWWQGGVIGVNGKKARAQTRRSSLAHHVNLSASAAPSRASAHQWRPLSGAVQARSQSTHWIAV